MLTLLCSHQDEAQKLEEDMDERHAAELAALEQREKDAAGPQQETVSILSTDLYSFNLSAEETQKNVGPKKRHVWQHCACHGFQHPATWLYGLATCMSSAAGLLHPSPVAISIAFHA